MLCSYGCGQKSIKKFSNGKSCCSEYYVQCPAIRTKNKTGLMKYYKEKGKYYLYSLEEVFTKNSSFSNDYLKERILNNNLLPYECGECKLKEWMEILLTLDLHHKDGDITNNELENLQFLCPNCHSITENYKGRNINTGKIKVPNDILIEVLYASKSIREALFKVGLAPKGGNYDRVKKLIKEFNISVGG